MMVRAAAAAELLAALLLLLATMVGISACTTEEDCSLLGARTAGACIYDAELTGADRAVLVVPLKHDDEGHEDACDKHTGQCCHHACKMTNWNCCHHGEHCCCGGPPQRISNCSADEYRPFQPFPIPRMPAPAPPAPAPPPTPAGAGPPHCCFFANFTECDEAPSESCETVPCIKGVTCPVSNTSSSYFSGHWCDARVWRTSCRMGWTHGCSCNVTKPPDTA
jgi:hypothetical protein